jgi:hypothetical protein
VWSNSNGVYSVEAGPLIPRAAEWGRSYLGLVTIHMTIFLTKLLGMKPLVFNWKYPLTLVKITLKSLTGMSSIFMPYEYAPTVFYFT